MPTERMVFLVSPKKTFPDDLKIQCDSCHGDAYCRPYTLPRIIQYKATTECCNCALKKHGKDGLLEILKQSIDAGMLQPESIPELRSYFQNKLPPP